jgi:hypothetical protein
MQEECGQDPRSGSFNAGEILRALREAGSVDSKPGLSTARVGKKKETVAQY